MGGASCRQSQLWAEPTVGRASCWRKEGFHESLPDLHVALYKETLEANSYEASTWSPTKFRRALVREAHLGESTGLG